MYLLNYIYFLIITLLGLKFLTMKRGVMVNPLNREQKMVMDGPEMFWVLTFSTGLLALSADNTYRDWANKAPILSHNRKAGRQRIINRKMVAFAQRSILIIQSRRPEERSLGQLGNTCKRPHTMSLNKMYQP